MTGLLFAVFLVSQEEFPSSISPEFYSVSLLNNWYWSTSKEFLHAHAHTCIHKARIQNLKPLIKFCIYIRIHYHNFHVLFIYFFLLTHRPTGLHTHTYICIYTYIVCQIQLFIWGKILYLNKLYVYVSVCICKCTCVSEWIYLIIITITNTLEAKRDSES